MRSFLWFMAAIFVAEVSAWFAAKLFDDKMTPTEFLIIAGGVGAYWLYDQIRDGQEAQTRAIVNELREIKSAIENLEQ